MRIFGRLKSKLVAILSSLVFMVGLLSVWITAAGVDLAAVKDSTFKIKQTVVEQPKENLVQYRKEMMKTNAQFIQTLVIFMAASLVVVTGFWVFVSRKTRLLEAEQVKVKSRAKKVA